MSIFLDVRALNGSGDVSPTVQIKTGTTLANYADLRLADLKTFLYGKDVLIGTHGFNVHRARGIENLSYWEGLLQLPPNAVFLGLLWPGDSESFHALSYPVEPAHAVRAGNLIG